MKHENRPNHGLGWNIATIPKRKVATSNAPVFRKNVGKNYNPQHPRMVYSPTFTIKINQILGINTPCMDAMGGIYSVIQ